MELKNVIEILVQGKYERKNKIDKKLVNANIRLVYYNFIMKNGGKIRILHYNKALFVRERYEILLFIPGKKDAVKLFKIKRDSSYFDIVDDIYHEKVKKEGYSKYFE